MASKQDYYRNVFITFLTTDCQPLIIKIFYLTSRKKEVFMLEREEVLKLAKLSRLSIAEEDIPAIKGHLDKMLDHLEALKALDLSNVEPMTAVENGATILREDVPVQGFTLEQAFANAPAVENDHFAIPKVM